MKLESSLRSARVVGQFLAILAVLLVLPSCGGGVDSGGTGNAAATLAVGPITGFGSIVVAGVHYDESGARIEDGDGQARDAGSLRLGMSTRIEAGALRTVGTRVEAAASKVVVDVQVLGRVQALDTVNATLRVLGQTVAVDGRTALDDFAQGLASLRVGDVVAVHGQVDAAVHRIVATRLEPAPAATAFIVRGAVQSWDATGLRAQVAGVTLDLSALSVADRPASVTVGQRVRARLQTTANGDVWTVLAWRDDAPALPDADNVELEGRISAFTSPQQFSVDGVQVDASAATFPDGTAGLGLGTRVEVEGRAVGGLVRARVVELEDDEDEGGYEIEGSITTLDRVARRFTVRSVVVSVVDNTRYEHGTEADLAVGRRVSVKGDLSPDGTQLVARTVEFH